MPDPDIIKDFIYEYLNDYLSSLEFGPDESQDYFDRSKYVFVGKSMIDEPLSLGNISIVPAFNWFPKTNKLKVMFKIVVSNPETNRIKDLEKIGFKFNESLELELKTNIEGEDVGLSPELIDENYIFEYIRIDNIDDMFDALEYDGIMDNVAKKIIELGNKGLIDLSQFE